MCFPICPVYVVDKEAELYYVYNNFCTYVDNIFDTVEYVECNGDFFNSYRIFDEIELPLIAIFENKYMDTGIMDRAIDEVETYLWSIVDELKSYYPDISEEMYLSREIKDKVGFLYKELIKELINIVKNHHELKNYSINKKNGNYDNGLVEFKTHFLFKLFNYDIDNKRISVAIKIK